MFHPIGSQPPSVYWRRRLLLVVVLFAVVGLLAITARVAFGGGGSPTPAADSSRSTDPRTHSPTTHPATHSPSITPSTHPASGATTSAVSGSGSPSSGATSPGGSTSSSAVPAACQLAELSVAAKTQQASYTVGSDPVLMLQVTNSSSTPCVHNLADSQVLLTVYDGTTRVWGSHDCKIEPGTDDRTLAAHQSVDISIVWSGLSSKPDCAGTREPVGAGNYTLVAALSGKQGPTATFTLT